MPVLRDRRSLLQKAVVIATCGVIPLLSLYYVLGNIVRNGIGQSVDFGIAYYPAAKAILAGGDPYPVHGFVLKSGIIVDYVYPPLTALAVVPLTVFPVDVALAIYTGVLIAAFLATLWVLDVRDWRCYGLAFVWPPVLEAIQTGNITIFLALAAALAWRLRDSPRACGAAIGLSLAAKILLWPLTVWCIATRRIRAAAWSAAVAVGALFLTWAAIGFRGLTEYPHVLGRLSDAMDERAYSVYALGVDLGVAPGVARAAWIVVGLLLLASVVVRARRGDERGAFILALAATIALTPIVWLHYWVLLVLIVAIASPDLGPLWFIGFPMQIVVTTGLYNGSTFQNAAVLVLAAATVAIALVRPQFSLRSMSQLSPAPGAG
jgi:alpha-1,2-mannosyltransferase